MGFHTQASGQGEQKIRLFRP